jgi:hypothetical protein
LGDRILPETKSPPLDEFERVRPDTGMSGRICDKFRDIFGPKRTKPPAEDGQRLGRGAIGWWMAAWFCWLGQSR